MTGSTTTALPTYSFDQIAQQLTHGYWNFVGESWRKFGTPTITYNVQNLTVEGQTLAVAALQAWTNVAGIAFAPTTGSAQITFDDNQSGAFETDVRSGTTTLSATINVSTQWLASYGTGINGYSFQTYIHEIGHALGLGHAGNYNGSAGWSAAPGGDNQYLNDSWQATIMSYFDQDENTSVNATRAYVVGPMIADIIAIHNLYGAPTNVRTEATTYGFGSTAGSIYNFANYSQGNMVAFAIFDNGGIDTLNASGFSAAQAINLTAETYSDIGGEVGNIGIARNTVIENAVGGSGADTITGNAAANVITGNGGNDTINGGGGADTAVYGGTRAAHTLTAQTNGTVSVTDIAGGSPDGSDTLSGMDYLRFDNVTLATSPNADFTGDFSGDIVLRSAAQGAVTLWKLANGSFAQSTFLGGMGSNIEIVDAGDFNDDGTSDLLLRDHISGEVTNWQIRNGNFLGSAFLGTVGGSVKVVGAGDFNLDGNSDVLLRHQAGGISILQVNPNNSAGPTTSIGGIGGEIQIAAIADFNGNGMDDILLRETATGAVTFWSVNNNAFAGSLALGRMGSNIEIFDAVDLTGDANADILLRDHITGAITYWEISGTGAFVRSTQLGGVGGEIDIIGARDIDGNGYSDVLLRNTGNTEVSAFLTNGGSYSGYVGLGAAELDWMLS